ncbi:MAG: dockerin type I domain-containing protein [Planctomycetota bacterium]|nr:dockerin type I domain-containing protein [Planctomycetota bacterium]
MSRAFDVCLTIFCLQLTAVVSAVESITGLLDPGDGTELVRVVVHRTADPISWSDASAQARSSGGNLFAPPTSALNQQAAQLAGNLGGWECTGPWLGILRVPSTDSIETGWIKTDRSSLEITEWAPDSPAGAPRLPWFVAFDARTGLDGSWINTVGDPDFGTAVDGLVMAFPVDAPDCDQDGFPDGFEIVFLSAKDADKNGIPDDCEPILGDISGDGLVNGVDLALLLGAWGTSTKEFDLDGDGIVSAADLTILLGSWTG